MTFQQIAYTLHNFSFFRIPLSANYICVRCSNDGTYQYAVSFSPPVDSLGMRKKIVHNHEGTIGRVHAFDGATLYVPKQLNGEVSRCLVNDNKLLDSMFISTGRYISLGFDLFWRDMFTRIDSETVCCHDVTF